MKVLVTGATGMVGSVLTQRLVAGGADVRILHRRSSPLQVLGAALPLVERVEGDLLNYERLQAAMDGVDQVYHVAALIGVGTRREWPALRRVNVQGTAAVVDAALRAGVQRMVHTSSIAALGRPEHDDVTIDESAEWHPSRNNSWYARSKHLAELEVHRGIAEGLDAVLVNPTMIFGVGRPGENTRAIVDKIRKQRLPVAPAGGTNFVDVEDVADGHIRAMQHGLVGERYILGGDNLSWRSAMRKIADAFGVRPPRFVVSPPVALAIGAVLEGVSFLAPGAGVITRQTARASSQTFRYDNRKAREELGCSFRSFDETAARLAEIIGTS